MQSQVVSAAGFFLLGVVAATGSAHGRTIELTDLDADRLAVIGPEAPRMSWVCSEAAPGMFVNYLLTLRPRAAVLIRVPLDKIPAGMRIAKAEWILSMTSSTIVEPRLYVWRLLGNWGPGVCYQYRTTRGKPVEWATAGARAGGSDRVQRPTAVVPCKLAEDIVLNVTEDVELWHSGAAPNSGWMFTIEDAAQVTFTAPAYTTRGSWKLRITYEPQ